MFFFSFDDTPTPSLEGLPLELQHKIFGQLGHQEAQALMRSSVHLCLSVIEGGCPNIILSSPGDLEGVVTHLETRETPGGWAKVRTLTIRWRGATLAPEKVRRVNKAALNSRCDRISACVKRLFHKHCEKIEELVLDFPGAFECFQNAILPHGLQFAPRKYVDMHKLTIRNGGAPVLTSGGDRCENLLTAISTVGGWGLKELTIDGDHPGAATAPLGLTHFQPAEFPLGALRHLTVRNLPGFDGYALASLVDGLYFAAGAIETADATLDLTHVPDISVRDVAVVLARIGRNIGSLRLHHPHLVRPAPATPAPWWKLWTLPLRPRALVLGLRPIEGPKPLPPPPPTSDELDAKVHLCDIIRRTCTRMIAVDLSTGAVCRDLFFDPVTPDRPANSLLQAVILTLAGKKKYCALDCEGVEDVPVTKWWMQKMVDEGAIAAVATLRKEGADEAFMAHAGLVLPKEPEPEDDGEIWPVVRA
ncbi:hypothetical protein EDC01DRAFT_748223 [Geopyxis carbonaria]|nr:hypothetical protein EDC01DRAFT_748223 [Geopyxis carbonaria]